MDERQQDQTSPAIPATDMSQPAHTPLPAQEQPTAVIRIHEGSTEPHWSDALPEQVRGVALRVREFDPHVLTTGQVLGIAIGAAVAAGTLVI
ncbi:MAG: hypothetical protein ACTHMR_23970, partial [Thermomicrobiales bacterium]